MSRRQPPTPPSPPGDDEAKHFLLVLEDVSALGMAICREAAQICKDRADSVDVIATTVAAYCRASRGVRRAIMLSRRIRSPELTNAQVHHFFVRKRILREVEAALDRANYRPADAQLLRQELHDRLDAQEIDSAILHLPIDEIIAAICRDLGIAMAVLDLPIGPRGAKDIQLLCRRAAGLPTVPSDAAKIVSLHKPPAQPPPEG